MGTLCWQPSEKAPRMLLMNLISADLRMGSMSPSTGGRFTSTLRITTRESFGFVSSRRYLCTRSLR